jgi:hypothetical protein
MLQKTRKALEAGRGATNYGVGGRPGLNDIATLGTDEDTEHNIDFDFGTT